MDALWAHLTAKLVKVYHLKYGIWVWVPPADADKWVASGVAVRA